MNDFILGTPAQTVTEPTIVLKGLTPGELLKQINNVDFFGEVRVDKEGGNLKINKKTLEELGDDTLFPFKVFPPESYIRRSYDVTMQPRIKEFDDIGLHSHSSSVVELFMNALALHLRRLLNREFQKIVADKTQTPLTEEDKNLLSRENKAYLQAVAALNHYTTDPQTDKGKIVSAFEKAKKDGSDWLINTLGDHCKILRDELANSRTT